MDQVWLQPDVESNPGQCRHITLVVNKQGNALLAQTRHRSQTAGSSGTSVSGMTAAV